MTDADRAQIAELTTMLTKYFVNQQRTCTTLSASLTLWRQQARDLEHSLSAEGFTHQARRLGELITPINEFLFVFGTIRDTAHLAQQQMSALLELVGVERGAPS